MGGPKPRKVGPRKGGGPKFRAFFPVSRHRFAVSVSLSGSSRGFLVVFEAPGTFGVLGLSCEAPAAPKLPGFYTTAREPKRARLRVLVFKTPPQINEKTPREGRKERILRRERKKKKSEILGGPWRGRSMERAVLGRRFSGRAVLGHST